MYLALLNGEKKELFLNLACRISAADGNFSDEEKAMIDGYCKEMQTTFDYEQNLKTVEEIISKMKAICSMTEKKIIVFEAMGLVMVDGKFDISEKKIVADMNAAFALPVEYPDNCEAVLQEYFSLQGRIHSIVIGG